MVIIQQNRVFAENSFLQQNNIDANHSIYFARWSSAHDSQS